MFLRKLVLNFEDMPNMADGGPGEVCSLVCGKKKLSPRAVINLLFLQHALLATFKKHNRHVWYIKYEEWACKMP